MDGDFVAVGDGGGDDERGDVVVVVADAAADVVVVGDDDDGGECDGCGHRRKDLRQLLFHCHIFQCYLS